MSVFEITYNDDVDVSVTVNPAKYGGYDATGVVVDYGSGVYVATREVRYLDYCLWEVVGLVAHEALSSVFVDLDPGFNVWESLPDDIPECECE